MRRHLLTGLMAAALAAAGCGESLPGGGGGGGGSGCTPSSGSQLASLAFTEASVSMAPGARVPIRVNAVYTDGCVTDVTNAVYLSVDTASVARIGRDMHFDGSAARWLEGISTGTASLVASTQKNAAGVVSSPMAVTVKECSGENTPISSLYAMPSMIQVAKGASERIRVFAVWESGCAFDATSRIYLTVADESVARIDAMTTAVGGRQVTGLSEGTTTVVASVKAGGEGMRAPEVTVQVVPEGHTTPGGGGNNSSDPENPETPVDPPPPDPDPDPQTVTLKSLTIYPEDLSLSPVDRMPITVVASWSDGTTRDVTKEASLASSNPAAGRVVNAVLAVDPATVYVEAVANGTTEITASWSDGKESASGSRTMTVSSRTTETRTIWVSRWNLGSSESAIRSNIQKFARSGFNAVYFQVMGDGTAYYASNIIPVKSSSLDSLGVAVDEAHKQGIQLHAYINALVAPKTVPTSGKHILVSHPEYVCLDASGNVISDDGYTWVAAEDGYIDYYKKVVKEILDNYDVDGIHVDRIRSPNKNSCHTAKLDALFEQEKAAGTVSSWQEFYTGRVTKLAQAIYETVVTNKPSALVSFAVWGIYKKLSGCSTSQGIDYNQDTVAWMKMGIADAISPMTYWNFGAYSGCADWGKHADFFKANSYGRQVIMGMHAQDSSAVDVSKITKRIQYARDADLAGTAIFASNYFSDDNWSAIKSGPYAAPADPTPIVHR